MPARPSDVGGGAVPFELCRRLDIPASEVNSLEVIVADPELHRRTLVDAVHPVVGRYLSVASPALFDGVRSTVRRHAPLVGENTEEVLRELGYSPIVIDALLSAGVAVQAALVRSLDPPMRSVSAGGAMGSRASPSSSPQQSSRR